MAKEIISHNPFDDLPDYRKAEKKEQEYIMNIKDAKIINMSEEVLNNIDFDDKTFINRQIEDIDSNEGIEELTESIYYAGLINPIYLQKKENGLFRILSGYRRSLAVKNGFANYDGYNVEGQCIVVPEDADRYELELISLHENIYREELKLIELAYKINRDAKEFGKTFEELSEDYGMSTRQLKRIKGALKYDVELKEILDEVGIKKAELLNRIIKLLRDTKRVNEILDLYKDKTASELEELIKELKSKVVKDKVEIKRDKKKTVIKINKNLSDEEYKELMNLLNKFK